MTDFIMMVGLPGSGKSHWADEKFKEKRDYGRFVLISSDKLRKSEYGDESVQGDNQKLFQMIHKTIKERLTEGDDVIFDATNINYKHRVQLLQFLKNVPNVRKTAVVMATPIDKCLERNQGRVRNVPSFVVDRMWKSFTCPTYGEGWNDIQFVFPTDDELEFKYGYTMGNLFDKMSGFEQDNPNHTMDLLGHSLAVVRNIGHPFDMILHSAAYLHDVGKLYTKTFGDINGNNPDVAHYYSHESVSSYEAMFYCKILFIDDKDITKVCGLIQNHMRLHNGFTEKTKNKMIGLLGDDGWSNLIALTEADKKGK